MNETDGIEETMDGMLRVAVTAAGQLGEQTARLRERQLRHTQDRTEAQVRELEARVRSERTSAIAALAPIHRSEWWQGAGAQQVSDAYATARPWRDLDPEAARAEQRIRDEVRDRYGVHIDDAGADPQAVRADLIREERRRRTAKELEAAALVNWTETSTQLTSGPKFEYDSPERRDATEQALLKRGVAVETAETRMRADISQAKPAAEAARTAAPSTSKVRRRSVSPGRQAEREGPQR
jgi:hypothetical protein